MTGLQEHDVIVTTKGQRPGRVGIVQRSFSWGDRVRVQWSTRDWAVPKRSTYSGGYVLVHLPRGCRISADVKPRTLQRYGIVRVPAELVNEWNERAAAIRAAELAGSISFREGIDSGAELRAEMVARAEPVEL